MNSWTMFPSLEFVICSTSLNLSSGKSFDVSCYFGCRHMCVSDPVSRIGHYLQYPKSTDIEVVRNDTLSFPQVTICNENSSANKQQQNTVSILLTL